MPSFDATISDTADSCYDYGTNGGRSLPRKMVWVALVGGVSAYSIGACARNLDEAVNAIQNAGHDRQVEEPAASTNELHTTHEILLTSDDMLDIYKHYKGNANYAKRFTGRYFVIIGTVENTKITHGYNIVIHGSNPKDITAWCKSISGHITYRINMRVDGILSSDPFKWDKMGKRYYLDNCAAHSIADP